MCVSKNSGAPKSSILIGFSIINHPFWGTPMLGNPQISGREGTPRTVRSGSTRIAELHALKDESNAIGEEMRSVKREKLKAGSYGKKQDLRMSIYIYIYFLEV